MKKISDRLDFFDKMLDLRNNYIENQKQCIENEIRWLENNIENTDNLRFYFTNSLHMEWAMKLNKNEGTSVDISNPLRRRNKIIMGGREREGPGLEEQEEREGK